MKVKKKIQITSNEEEIRLIDRLRIIKSYETGILKSRSQFIRDLFIPQIESILEGLQ